jgi:hypothetical protein
MPPPERPRPPTERTSPERTSPRSERGADRETIDYDALIEKRGKQGEAELRKRANRLAEIARNLESLQKLAEAEAKKRASEEAPADPTSPRNEK